MSSYIDMSLEDIIQKKKKEKPRNKRPLNMDTAKSNNSNKTRHHKLAITDARNKIISKKRTQIVDAREKLEELAKQRDARFKLEQLRKMRGMNQIQGRITYQRQNKFINKGKLTHLIGPTVGRDHPTVSRDRVFVDSSRQVVSQPLSTTKISMRRQLNAKRFLENRSIGSKHSDRMPRLKPIVRTVENDIEITDDPMGEYESINMSSDRKASLQLKIIAHNSEGRASRSSIIHRIAEKEKSPPRPPSILKKRPMAALRTEKTSEKMEKPNLEFRIIVSNLGNTVTGGDIEELFGDVGGMVEFRLVRPGTAEVIYKTQEDAQRAVDLYHNRQLDGQPMNCLLVTPRASSTMSRSNSGTKPALFSTNSNVEPDISTFHKVLFSNL
ncbi:polymerase delta-interacting protein 3 isoform X1 [Amyelois transitella]|uniref:polymerase delta-interacting protein 3 isoform X1 n=1 Tax=Amyelois transitella TaxID=680683 RepID=UPI00298FC4D0|nr:polymerase delta-interacting protein 3 isoform X1 [Amyelois transitella]